ncbi:CotO family spore coat protein [Virgibacillus sp. W0430]|uniref:CotO family spore coat protein n=1 Tax=Virgibacillus sp. W0430 TaxID=3391580 RepID=UPI003F46FCFE
MRKQYAQDPLLYIQQPKRSTPKAKMQSSYTTKSQRNQSSQVNQPLPSRGAVKKKIRKKHLIPNADLGTLGYEMPAQSELSEETKDSTEDEESEKTEPKKFNQLTVEQKIDYFIKRPRFAPAVKCEVKTTDKRYKGVIMDKVENNIKMKVGRRETETSLPIKAILEINLIGF